MTTLRKIIISNFCDDEHDIERVLVPIEKEPYKYANGSIMTKPMLRDYAFELVEKSHQEQIAALQQKIAALQQKISESESESESESSESESESSESSESESESSESTLNTRRCGNCGECGHYRNNCPRHCHLPMKPTSTWNNTHKDYIIKKYTCPFCSKQEMNKSNLDRHKRNNHPKDIPN